LCDGRVDGRIPRHRPAVALPSVAFGRLGSFGLGSFTRPLACAAAPRTDDTPRDGQPLCFPVVHLRQRDRIAVHLIASALRFRRAAALPPSPPAIACPLVGLFPSRPVCPPPGALAARPTLLAPRPISARYRCPPPVIPSPPSPVATKPRLLLFIFRARPKEIIGPLSFWVCQDMVRLVDLLRKINEQISGPCV
jgi:hypothetical protein